MFEGVIRYRAEQVAGHDLIALRHRGREIPDTLAIQCLRLRTPRDGGDGVGVVADSSEQRERPLGAVEDLPEKSRAQLDLERLPGADDRLADCEPGSVFVHLNDTAITIDPDDFARQSRRADEYDVVEPRMEADGLGNGAGYPP